MKDDTRVWPPIKRPKRQEIVDEALEDMDIKSLQNLARKEVLAAFYHTRNRRSGRKL